MHGLRENVCQEITFDDTGIKSPHLNGQHETLQLYTSGRLLDRERYQTIWLDEIKYIDLCYQ